MAAEQTVTLRVARGRTVYANGEEFTEGASVTLPKSDASRLYALGFLRADGDAETRPPTDSFVTMPQPGTVTVQAGPDVSGS
jgi:hypothetical protein